MGNIGFKESSVFPICTKFWTESNRKHYLGKIRGANYKHALKTFANKSRVFLKMAIHCHIQLLLHREFGLLCPDIIWIACLVLIRFHLFWPDPLFHFYV